MLTLSQIIVVFEKVSSSTTNSFYIQYRHIFQYILLKLNQSSKIYSPRYNFFTNRASRTFGKVNIWIIGSDQI